MPSSDPVARRAVARRHYVKNREKILAYHARYFAENPEHVRETKLRSSRKHAEKNRPINRERRKAAYWDNPDLARQAARDWRERNLEYAKQAKRDWDARNSDLVADPRVGHWSAEDDAIVLREDISTREKAVLLGRRYNSVANRLRELRYGERRPCKQCGAEFVSRPDDSQDSHNLFCSKDCSYEWRREHSPRRRSCAQCNREFHARTRDSRFCSLKCFGAGKIKYPPTPCLWCGKVFKPKVNKAGPTSYCSMGCAGKARTQRSGRLIPRTCCVCGEQYMPKDYRSKTCSRLCGSKSRGDRVPVVACEMCGTGICRRGAKFCSMDCYAASMKGKAK